MAEVNFVTAGTPKYDSTDDEERSEGIESIILPLNETINCFDDHPEVEGSILRGKLFA